MDYRYGHELLICLPSDYFEIYLAGLLIWIQHDTLFNEATIIREIPPNEIQSIQWNWMGFLSAISQWFFLHFCPLFWRFPRCGWQKVGAAKTLFKYLGEKVRLQDICKHLFPDFPAMAAGRENQLSVPGGTWTKTQFCGKAADDEVRSQIKFRLQETYGCSKGFTLVNKIILGTPHFTFY